VPESPALATSPALRTADFDFALPERLIAQQPARPRDAARLLLVRPDRPEDRLIQDLPGLLGPGDVLVVNDTRVIPARLHARRGEAALEILLNRAEGGGFWQALVRNARRLRPGDTLAGPCIVEEPWTTLLVLPGDVVRLDPYDSYVVTVGSGS
jgi:S-adenosylmethionine:tRNA ribosyltransferase-isomerase